MKKSNLIAVLTECVSMIQYVLDDGYYYEGGKELLRRAQKIIKAHPPAPEKLGRVSAIRPKRLRKNNPAIRVEAIRLPKGDKNHV